MVATDTDTSASSPEGVGGKPPLVIVDRDIVFNCPQCQGELVVDRDGAGLSVPCPHCEAPLTVPDYSQPPSVAHPASQPAPPVPAPVPVREFDFGDMDREQLERRFNDLKGQLKENKSQDTEMRGHVNRATMDLHRLQLKLRKLQDRQADIDAEINALADWLDNNAA